MLAVGNCCYVAVCSAAEGASAPTGEERGGASRGGRPPTACFHSFIDYVYWSLRRNCIKSEPLTAPTVPTMRLLSETCRKLLLQHNRLSRLPRNMIESLKRLVHVNLAYNDIVWLDVGSFSSTSLRHVDLSHNALRKLISMTFLYLPAAESIDLSHNQVRSLPREQVQLKKKTLKKHSILVLDTGWFTVFFQCFCVSFFLSY